MSHIKRLLRSLGRHLDSNVRGLTWIGLMRLAISPAAGGLLISKAWPRVLDVEALWLVKLAGAAAVTPLVRTLVWPGNGRPTTRSGQPAEVGNELV